MAEVKLAKPHKSKESENESLIRRYILLAILLSIGLFGLPIWFSTTTIHRAELPADKIHHLSQNLISDIGFRIPVYLDIPNSQHRLVSKAQSLIDQEIAKLIPGVDIWSVELKIGKGSLDDYSIKLDKSTEQTESVFISPYNKETTIYLTDNVVSQNLVDDFVMRVILYDIFVDEIHEIVKILDESSNKDTSDKSMIIPYDSEYNIVFSLFVEDGTPVTWDISEALNVFQPMLDNLHNFANFTVDTQVQYYSQLSNYPNFNETYQNYLLNDADISTFVNYGDWNLITTDSKPTLNFIVYIPSDSTKPFIIEDSSTNSFMIPQWGGVHILNKDIAKNSNLGFDEMLPIMEIFGSQLFQLLGATARPKSPFIRIDILSRLTTLKNLKQSFENLLSLVKLTSSLKEIAIPDFTLHHVLESLDYIKESINHIKEQNWSAAIESSSKAIQQSNSAFFEKGMLQQAYFPDEHKLAVYLPLLGPILSITALGLIKFVKDFKNLKKTSLL